MGKVIVAPICDTCEYCCYDPWDNAYSCEHGKHLVWNRKKCDLYKKHHAIKEQDHE